jgi:hypothetical protein
VIRHLPSALLRVSTFFAATDGLSQVRPIPFTAEPPTIDGKLDEPFWQVSKPTYVDRPRTRAGAITAPPPMVCKLAWDSQFLYFGYETQDAYLLGPGVGKQGGPREGLQTTPVDSERDRRPNLAQIYVSPQGSLTEFWQVQHSSDNEFHAHACVVAPESEWRNRGRPTNGDIQIDRDRFATDAGAGVAHAIHLLPKTDGEPSNDASDFDAGYSGEIRLPWATLGLPAARQRADGTYNLANHELRILAAAINPHAGQTRCWSSGELPTNRKIHFSAERWPRYRLTK